MFIFTARVGLDSNPIFDDSYSGSLCRLLSSLGNSTERSEEAFRLHSPNGMTLIFPDSPKILHKSLFFLQLICIPVCSCQWLIRDQLDLISFPALMFGLSSFPSLRIFAVAFPPAGVLVFCLTLGFRFLLQPQHLLYIAFWVRLSQCYAPDGTKL